MPYKSDKIKIEYTKFDRRIKLSSEDKLKIISLYKKGYSIREITRLFKVNRRLIQFILFPERQEINKRLRKERGGSKIYYDKDKNREIQKEHRRYKHKLYIENMI
jgi:transposase-like protein